MYKRNKYVLRPKSYYLQNYIYLSKVCTLITVVIKIVRNAATLFCWSGTHDDRNNI